MSPRADAVCFLLVEDFALLARAYQRILERYGQVVVASTLAEASVHVPALTMTGLIVDIELPDGSGVEIARQARERARDLPILFMSGAVNASLLKAAYEIGASYLLKPLEKESLDRFAERAIARQRRIAGLVDIWVTRHGLTAAEAVTLRLALAGMRKDGIAAKRGVSVYTARNQIIALLARTQIETLADVVAGFYRELALGDDGLPI